MNDKYFLGKTLLSEKGVCANSACGFKDVAESPVVDYLSWWYGNHYWIEKSKKGVSKRIQVPEYLVFIRGFLPIKNIMALLPEKVRLAIAA